MHLKFYNEYVMLVNTFGNQTIYILFSYLIPGTQTICILFSYLIADIVFLKKNLNNVQTALTISFNLYLARFFSINLYASEAIC